MKFSEQSSIKVVENGYMTMTVDNKYIIVCNEGYTLLGSPELKLDGTSSSKCISKYEYFIHFISHW